MIELPFVPHDVVGHVHWTIPGQPEAWARAGRKLLPGGKVLSFDPPKNKDYKSRVVSNACAAGLRGSPHPSGVRLVLVFYVKRPKSLMRKKDPDGVIFCTRKPDVDNLEKMISDALNTIGYQDDAQICDVRKVKYYHEKGGAPRTEIYMEFIA